MDSVHDSAHHNCHSVRDLNPLFRKVIPVELEQDRCIIDVVVIGIAYILIIVIGHTAA